MRREIDRQGSKNRTEQSRAEQSEVPFDSTQSGILDGLADPFSIEIFPAKVKQRGKSMGKGKGKIDYRRMKKTRIRENKMMRKG